MPWVVSRPVRGAMYQRDFDKALASARKQVRVTVIVASEHEKRRWERDLAQVPSWIRHYVQLVLTRPNG